MKKLIALITISVALSFFAFAVTEDYIAGYNQGYADALAGVPNIYQRTTALDPEDLGIWTIKYFVDDFGDFTDDAYVVTKTLGSGSFTNSSTKNSDLRWKILVDEDGRTAIFLYENGSSPVTGSSSYPTKYTISVKLSDGSIKTFSGENSHDRILLDINCMLEFLDLLFDGSPFKMIVTEDSSYFNTSYNLGTIEPIGFANAFNKAFPDYDREFIELLIILYYSDYT